MNYAVLSLTQIELIHLSLHHDQCSNIFCNYKDNQYIFFEKLSCQVKDCSPACRRCLRG